MSRSLAKVVWFLMIISDGQPIGMLYESLQCHKCLGKSLKGEAPLSFRFRDYSTLPSW